METRFVSELAFSPGKEWQLESYETNCFPAPRDQSKSEIERLVDYLDGLTKAGGKKHAPLSSSSCRWVCDGKGPRPAEPVANVILEQFVSDPLLKEIVVLCTVVDSYTTMDIQGLRSGVPSWTYYGDPDQQPLWAGVAGEIALLFPELFSFCRNETTAEESKNKNGAYQRGLILPAQNTWKYVVDELRNNLKYHRQSKTYSVEKLDFDRVNHSIKVKLRGHVSIAPYPRGRLCRCIPIPGKPPKPERRPKEPTSVRSPEVVLANRLVEEDMRVISQIWQDRSAKTVLVCGPPGSGKENYAKSLPFGAGRKRDAIQTISLAESEDDVTRQRLFGRKREDGTIALGLIHKAGQSAIFVDEAHYPEKKPGMRAALLRVLETGEYYPCGSDETEKVNAAESLVDVLWVFASSRDVSGPRSIGLVPPRDFWTRMTNLVQIHHPLNAAQLRIQLTGESSPKKLHDLTWWVCRQQKEALSRLFKFFWIGRLEEFYNQEIYWIPSAEEYEPANTENKGAAALLVDAKLRHLLEEKALDRISRAFGKHVFDEIGSPSLHTISIRGIRSMAGQLLSHAIRAIDNSEDSPWELLVKRQFDEVLTDIRQVATLSS
ncbi:MAG: sigma 54-interacting transcriptional regulator [Phycisphaerae bacterium]|nr:sigma 54-interacting transcriptional regulator [Phycisphaerae bacterium]